MVVINAYIYRQNNEFIAVSYEIAQKGHGKSRFEAEKDLLDALKNTIPLFGRRDNQEKISVLDPECSPKECQEGLERVFLSKKYIKPVIRRIGNLNIHFYSEDDFYIKDDF